MAGLNSDGRRDLDRQADLTLHENSSRLATPMNVSSSGELNLNAPKVDPEFREVEGSSPQGSVDDAEETYESGGFLSDLIGSSRSWMASMIVHVVLILLLALLTMRSSVQQTVYLEVGTDSFQGLSDLQELEFETNELTVSSTEVESDNSDLIAETIEFEPELESAELSDSELTFADPLLSQMATSAQEMQAHEILAGDSATSFFGIAATGESIVYIVDRSGSMQGARWQKATTELKKSVNSLKPDQNFYVFLFNGKCHSMPAMAGRNNLVPATDDNKRRFRKWLDRQYPDDTTKPLSSIRRAMNMRPDTIFLLTDGSFYDDTDEYLMRQARLRQQRTQPADLVINTIGFYCELSLEQMLIRIADAYEGVFRAIQ